MQRISVAIVALSSLVGCLGSESPSGPRGKLEISTSPLTLTSIGDACYGLTVKNASGQTVWHQDRLCADDFGDNRSAISYVGTCDASPGEAQHTVELVLVGLYDEGGGELTDYVNPAPSGRPIVLSTTCVENADTPVVFNLVIARAARQGFVDATVNFEDVFCSAKLDCSAGPLLADPVSGDRLPTAVAGLACTGGPGADTHIYYSGVSLVCDGVPIDISLARPPGNFYSQASPAPSPLAQVASYQGVEALTNPDGSPLSKAFFNLAFALPANATANCSLSFTATVSDGPLAACDTPSATVYPVIHFTAPVFSTLGALSCGANPLDGSNGVGVWTSYTDPSTPEHFAVGAHAENGALVVDSCAFCGDGRIEPGAEDCDPPAASLACDYGELSCTRCSSTCHLVPGTPSGYCGDATLQPGEDCDPPAPGLACDYGDVSCERCSSTCELVPGTPVGYCGDATLQPGEDCDPPSVSLECDYGQVDCDRCADDCQTVAGVPVGYCGDAVVQSPSESCDPPSGTLDCDAGVDDCMVCTATCQTVPGNPGPPVTPLTLSNGAPVGCVEQTGTTPHCIVAKVSCDDDCEVYLDGVRHYTFDSSKSWWDQRTIILSGITSGCHVLGVRTKDVFNVAAGFVGTITIDPAGTTNSGTYVTAQTNAITVSDVATVDAQGDTWSELDYDPVFPTAVQCTRINTWDSAPWFTWSKLYYSKGAYPIWYNANCAGDHSEAFARIVFTVPENGTICDPDAGGISTDGGQSWTPFAVPVCGDGTVDNGEQCDPPSPGENDCPYNQTCTGCDPLCQSKNYRGPYCGDGLVTDAETCDGAGTLPTCADLDPSKPYGQVTCGGCQVNANCSADPCYLQPTSYAGNVTLFGDQIPSDIPRPECITSITGDVTIAETVAFPANPVIRFPKLTSIYNSSANVTARLWILNWPDGVALFPELKYVERVRVTNVSGKEIVLPQLAEANPAVGTTDPISPFEVGSAGFIGINNTTFTLPALVSVSFVVTDTSTNSTFDIGPALVRFEMFSHVGVGTVFNLPSAITLLETFSSSGGTLTLNASGVRTIRTGNFVSPAVVSGLAAVTTIGPGLNVRLDATVNLAAVTTVSSSFPLTWNPQTATLPVVQSISSSNLTLISNGALTLPSSLTTLSAPVTLGSANTTSFSAPGLASVAGLIIDSLTSLTSISLPALRTDSGVFTIKRNPVLPVAQVNSVRNALTSGPTTTTICGNLNDVACP